MAERSARAVRIVTFLNAWKCRPRPPESRIVLRDWIRANADRLEPLSGVAVLDDDRRYPRYDSLWAAGGPVRTKAPGRKLRRHTMPARSPTS